MQEPTQQADKYAYDLEFQRQLLGICLRDRNILAQHRDAVNPEYFESESHRWICQKIIRFFDEFHDLPTKLALEAYLTELEDHPDRRHLYAEEVRALYDVELVNQEFVRSCIIQFGANQAMKIAILNSVPHLNRGDYNSVYSEVRKALKVGQRDYDLGYFYLRDFELRSQEAADQALDLVTIPTGWRRLDSLVRGGLHPGLFVVLAPYGKGKTTIMLNVGAVCIQLGRRVVHYTMELAKAIVRERYDMRISGIPAEHLPSQFKALAEKLEIVRRRQGELIIKEYPSGTINTRAIYDHLEKLIAEKQKPDLIILDYLKLIKSSERYDTKWAELGGICRELRGISTELQIPILTAQQTQRGTSYQELIEGDNVADSIEIMQECDVAITASQTLSESDTGRMRFTIVKNRYGPTHVTLNFDTDFNRMMVRESANAV